MLKRGIRLGICMLALTSMLGMPVHAQEDQSSVSRGEEVAEMCGGETIAAEETGEVGGTEEMDSVAETKPYIKGIKMQNVLYENMSTEIILDVVGTNLTYQWQYQNYTGWINMEDGVSIRGARTNHFIYGGTVFAQVGLPLRCIITGDGGTTYSQEFRMTCLERSTTSLVIAANFTDPVWGERPCTNLKSLATDVYKIHEVTWQKLSADGTGWLDYDTSKPFTEEGDYKVSVLFKFTDPYKSAGDAICVIGDHNADAEKINGTKSDEDFMFYYYNLASYTFHVAPANITEDLPAISWMNPGEDTSLTCKSGYPYATYQWYVSTNGGTSWAKATDSGAKTQELILKAGTVDAGTMYKCLVREARGCSYSNATTIQLVQEFGEHLKWTFDGSKLTVFGSGDMPEFTKPSDIPWFDLRSSITEIEIGDEVTSIGYMAFASTAITELTIPSGIVSIGANAFDTCSSLKVITFEGTSLKTIGAMAFRECRELGKAYMNPTAWAGISFANAGSLPCFAGGAVYYDIATKKEITGLTLGSNCTKISDFAFYGMTKLKEVTVPASVTSMGKRAFFKCTALEKVTISANSKLKTISEYAFGGCISLNSINLPKGLEVIERNAFHQAGLTEISLPDGMKAIGAASDELNSGAFLLCSSLKNITFEGSKPGVIAPYTFGNGEGDVQVKATVHYNSANSGWTSAATANYGGILTWVDEKPAAEFNVLVQPINAKVTSGGRVSFEFVVEGNDITYQWSYLKPGAADWANSGIAAAKTCEYAFNVNSGHDKMKIRCTAADSQGRTVTSDEVTLTVSAAGPLITKQSEDVHVATGEKAEYSVETNGAGYTYQWQYSKMGEVLWHNSSVASAKTADYYFTANSTHNRMRVRCIVTDKNGVKTWSNIIGTVVDSEMMPLILLPSGNRNYLSGDKLELKLTNGRTGLKYQWEYCRKGSSEWTKSSIASAKTGLYTFNLNANHDGMNFRCVVTDAKGKTYVSNEIKISVLAITKQPAAVTAAAGGTVNFAVTATGEGLTYQWKKSTDGGKTWVNSASTGAKTNKLTMTAKAGFDGYLFKCVVTDGSGKAVTSNAVKLSVTAAAGAPVITTQPANKTVAAGGTVTFRIAAAGEGLTYQWKKSTDGGKTWVNSSSSGATTNTLAMTAKASYNGILFKCTVKDKNGKSVDSSAAKLTVQ